MREEIDDLLTERALLWVVAPVLLWLVAFIQWLPRLMNATPTPWAFTILAAIVPLVAWRTLTHLIAYPPYQSVRRERVTRRLIAFTSGNPSAVPITFAILPTTRPVLGKRGDRDLPQP